MYVLSFFFFRAFESARERENGGSSRVRGVRYARVRVWREREREKEREGRIHSEVCVSKRVYCGDICVVSEETGAVKVSVKVD